MTELTIIGLPVIELLEWGRPFLDFWGKKVLHVYS